MTYGINNREDEFREYIGKEVRVIGRSGSQIGILEEINPQSLNYSLKPSLISIGLPIQNGRWKDDYYLNDETPTKIRKDLVETIQEVPKGYMEEILKRNYYFQNYKNTFGDKIRNKFKTLAKKLNSKKAE